MSFHFIQFYLISLFGAKTLNKHIYFSNKTFEFPAMDEKSEGVWRWK